MKMKIVSVHNSKTVFSLFLFLFASLVFESGKSFAQSTVRARTLTRASLPVELSFKGELNDARQWDDKLGTNILILSATPEILDSSQGQFYPTKTIELYAYHYVRQDSGYKLLWQLRDWEKQCDLDIIASFLSTTSITDLDSNGIAETCLMYRLSCASDVSPSTLKLIMHEGAKKFALRGYTWVRYGPDIKFNLKENELNLEKLRLKESDLEDPLKVMGRYFSEQDFLQAPAAFLRYARSQWYNEIKDF